VCCSCAIHVVPHSSSGSARQYQRPQAVTQSQLERSIQWPKSALEGGSGQHPNAPQPATWPTTCKPHHMCKVPTFATRCCLQVDCEPDYEQCNGVVCRLDEFCAGGRRCRPNNCRERQQYACPTDTSPLRSVTCVNATFTDCYESQHFNCSIGGSATLISCSLKPQQSSSAEPAFGRLRSQVRPAHSCECVDSAAVYSGLFLPVHQMDRKPFAGLQSSVSGGCLHSCLESMLRSCHTAVLCLHPRYAASQPFSRRGASYRVLLKCLYSLVAAGGDAPAAGSLGSGACCCLGVVYRAAHVSLTSHHTQCQLHEYTHRADSKEASIV
jgi:hypothetical protein